MEKMSFIDYMKKFQPGEPIKDVKSWIDALVNYQAASIVTELRTAGDESVLRLRRIGNMLEDCVHYLFTHDSEVCESYLIDGIRPWLTQYSQKHLNDGVLYLNSAIEDKDGNCDYLKDHFPWMYGDDTEAVFSVYTTNGSVENAIPDPGQEHEYTQEQEEEISRDNAEYYEWYDSLTEEEQLKLGFSIGEEMANPLKDELERRRVKDALKIINDKVRYAKNTIKDFFEWHGTSLKCPSLAEYAEAIAPVIDGKIFEGHIEAAQLESVLKAEPVEGLSLKPQKDALMVLLFKILTMDGPAECREEGWRVEVAKPLKLESAVDHRWNYTPGEKSQKILNEVLNAIKEIKRVDTTNYII